MFQLILKICQINFRTWLSVLASKELLHTLDLSLSKQESLYYYTITSWMSSCFEQGQALHFFQVFLFLHLLLFSLLNLLFHHFPLFSSLKQIHLNCQTQNFVFHGCFSDFSCFSKMAASNKICSCPYHSP